MGAGTCERWYLGRTFGGIVICAADFVLIFADFDIGRFGVHGAGSVHTGQGIPKIRVIGTGVHTDDHGIRVFGTGGDQYAYACGRKRASDDQPSDTVFHVRSEGADFGGGLRSGGVAVYERKCGSDGFWVVRIRNGEGGDFGGGDAPNDDARGSGAVHYGTSGLSFAAVQIADGAFMG